MGICECLPHKARLSQQDVPLVQPTDMKQRRATLPNHAEKLHRRAARNMIPAAMLCHGHLQNELAMHPTV